MIKFIAKSGDRYEAKIEEQQVCFYLNGELAGAMTYPLDPREVEDLLGHIAWLDRGINDSLIGRAKAYGWDDSQTLKPYREIYGDEPIAVMWAMGDKGATAIFADGSKKAMEI